jgi:hypothetical protein
MMTILKLIHNCKKMKAFYYTVTGLVIAMMFFACSEPENWNGPKDNIPPGTVSIKEVTNLNGGARIIYSLPSDEDVIGAKVVYSLTPDGETMERFATNDTIELEGYGDTNPRTVMAYAIDYSGNVSEGTPVNISPLTPPISLIRETLLVDAAFGGIRVTWDNEMAKEMSVLLYLPDTTTDEMVLYDTYFSDNPEGKVVFRPFDPVEQQVKVELRDRWSNYSAPLETSVTPLFEEEILSRDEYNTEIWKEYGDADDTYWDRGDVHNDVRNSLTRTRTFSLATNLVIPTTNTGYWNPGTFCTIADYVPGSAGNIPFPWTFTIDMGRKATYSRMRIYARIWNPTYRSALPCDFEVWGSNDPKPLVPGDRMANLAYWTEWPQANGAGEWKNDWVKLANCKITTVSGTGKYTIGMPLSQEDIDRYTKNGYDFDMTEEVYQPFRYLRFLIKDTNTSASELMITEIRFWGSLQE